MVVGVAFGYVLGARAGRGRYEQIKDLALQARKHPAVAQLVDEGVGLVDGARYAMAAGLNAGSRGLRALESQGESG